MLPRCLNCSHHISLSWHLFAFKWTKYRCVKCGAIHESTNLKGAYAVILVLLTPLSFKFFNNDAIMDFFGFFLYFSAISLILSILPGQHKLSKESEYSGKQT